MKRSNPTAQCIFLACLFLTNISSAQIASVPPSAEFPGRAVMDPVRNAETGAIEIGRENVTGKALRSFREQFTNGIEPQWFQVGHNYLAMFESEGRLTRALFARNGYVFYTLTYGNAKHLPADVKVLLNESYKGYNIGCVQDAYYPGLKGWVVNLQHNNRLVVVLVSNKVMNVLFDSREMPELKTAWEKKAPIEKY